MKRTSMLCLAALILCVSLFAWTGCAPRAVVAPPPPPSQSAGEIVAALSSRLPPDIALRSTARLSATSPKGRLSTRIVLVAKRPCFLRIESISLLGLPDLILTADEREVRIFAVKEGKFYIGPAGENLSRYFPIHLSPEEAVQLLLGLPPGLPPVATGGETVLKIAVEGEFYRLDAVSAGERFWTLWLDPADLTIRRIERLEGGERIYLAELSDYGNLDGTRIPGKVEIEFNRPEKSTVTIRYPDREVAAAPKEEFHLEAPEGVPRVYLD